MCELIFFKNFTHILFSNTPIRSQVLPLLPLLPPTTPATPTTPTTVATVATVERNEPKEYETQNFAPITPAALSFAFHF